jgi:hypothetical protein
MKIFLHISGTLSSLLLFMSGWEMVMTHPTVKGRQNNLRLSAFN